MYVNSEEIDFNKKIISDDGEIQIEVAIPKDKQLYITCNNDESIERIYTLDISLVFKFKITLLKLVSIIRRSYNCIRKGNEIFVERTSYDYSTITMEKYFLRFYACKRAVEKYCGIRLFKMIIINGLIFLKMMNILKYLSIIH